MVVAMTTNFGTKIAITCFVWTIATRQLVMGGLRGRPTKCRYCRYTETKGRCHGKHFLPFYICGAHWRHPADTTEPSLCCCDAVLCQITLTTCYYYYGECRPELRCITKYPDVVRDTWSPFLQVNGNNLKTLRNTHKYNGRVIGNHM